MTTRLDHRTWSDDDRARIAAYRENRARARPPKCIPDAERCWVEHGPLALRGISPCLGCGGYPRTLSERHRDEALNR